MSWGEGVLACLTSMGFFVALGTGFLTAVFARPCVTGAFPFGVALAVTLEALLALTVGLAGGFGAAFVAAGKALHPAGVCQQGVIPEDSC